MESSTKSLTKDLKDIDIPTIIKEKANELYIKFQDTSPKKIYRRKPREAIKFAFIFKAYYSFKIPVDPKLIIERLGITGSHSSIIKMGMSLTFSDNDGILDDQYFSVKEMTSGILTVLGYPLEWLKNTNTLNSALECFRPDLIFNKPQDIAVGIVYFYARHIKAYKVDVHDIHGKLYTSKSLLTTIYKALEDIVKATNSI